MITQILFQQTVIMFLLMLLGFVLARAGMLTEQGSRDISNVLLYAVIPCVILRSYMTGFSMDKLYALGWSAVVAVIAFVVTIAVAWLCYDTRRRIENFSVAFGNAGFIGIPLVTAVFGTEAAFYVVAFSTLLNLLQWTYGIVIISGKKETINLRMVFINPVFLSMTAGLLIFLFQPPLSSVVTGTIGYIADANTLLAMVVLGYYLSKVDLRGLFGSDDDALFLSKLGKRISARNVQKRFAEWGIKQGLNSHGVQHSDLCAEIRAGLPAGGDLCLPVHRAFHCHAAARYAAGGAYARLNGAACFTEVLPMTTPPDENIRGCFVVSVFTFAVPDTFYYLCGNVLYEPHQDGSNLCTGSKSLRVEYIVVHTVDDTLADGPDHRLSCIGANLVRIAVVIQYAICLRRTAHIPIQDRC